VHNYRQYQFVNAFDFRPEMTHQVWRRGRYLEARGRFIGRKPPARLETYPAAPPP